jgi:hypothetical protein
MSSIENVTLKVDQSMAKQIFDWLQNEQGTCSDVKRRFHDYLFAD